MPSSLNSWVAATNNILLVIKSEALEYNRYSIKDSQQIPIIYKASGKNKLEESKKWSYLKLAIYSFKEDSKGEPIKYKKLNNSKTKLGRYNKWP